TSQSRAGWMSVSLDSGRTCRVFLRFQDNHSKDIPLNNLEFRIDCSANLHSGARIDGTAQWVMVAEQKNKVVDSLDWKPGAILEVRCTDKNTTAMKLADWEVHLSDGKPYDSQSRRFWRWVWVIGSIVAAVILAAWAQYEKAQSAPV